MSQMAQAIKNAAYASGRAIAKIVRPISGQGETSESDGIFSIHGQPLTIAGKKVPSQLVAQYRGWVYACANRNAQAVAQTPLRLYVTTTARRGDATPRVARKSVDPTVIEEFSEARGPFIRTRTGPDTLVEEVTDHPFLDLMANANPAMDGFEALQLIQLYQELIGDAYLYKVPSRLLPVVEIWPLLAHLVKLIPHPTLFIQRYEYGTGPIKTNFRPQELAHFRMPNPSSYYTGMSPLAAAASQVDLAEYMSTYEASLFMNRARPEQVLIPTQPLHKTARDRVEAKFNKAMRGVTKAGKTIVLPFGFDLKPLAFAPKELAYLISTQANQETISAIFDIPATLMAAKSGGRAKDEAAEYMHAKYGVKPRCIRMEQRLNQDLVSLYDKRLFCAFDNPVPRDKEFELKKRTADLRSGKTTINEARAQDGQKPTWWGEEPLIPQNVVPLSEAIATQKASREAKAKSKGPDQEKKVPGSAEPAPGDATKPGRQKDPAGGDKKS